MLAIRILLASFAIVGALGIAQVSAERAAGIDYEFVDRPAKLPADFQASAGTNLRFLAMYIMADQYVLKANVGRCRLLLERSGQRSF
jgi:hypothetical protein